MERIHGYSSLLEEVESLRSQKYEEGKRGSQLIEVSPHFLCVCVCVGGGTASPVYCLLFTDTSSGRF